MPPSSWVLQVSASVSFKSHHQEFQVSEVVLDEESEIMVLGFEAELPTGEGILGIRFSGVLNDHIKYVVDGVERNILVTQFEAVEARKCFPCWDEPAFKESGQAVTLRATIDRCAFYNCRFLC